MRFGSLPTKPQWHHIHLSHYFTSYNNNSIITKFIHFFILHCHRKMATSASQTLWTTPFLKTPSLSLSSKQSLNSAFSVALHPSDSQSPWWWSIKLWALWTRSRRFWWWRSLARLGWSFLKSLLMWIALTISVPKSFAPRSCSMIKTQIFHLLSSISWCLVRSLFNSSSSSLSLTPWPISSDWVVYRSRFEREKHRGSGFSLGFVNDLWSDRCYVVLLLMLDDLYVLLLIWLGFDLLVFFFFFFFCFCVFGSKFVFLLFLFKTHLDLNSCDFWFLILFLNFFYLVKINKLIFNLDVEVAFFNAK